MQSETLKVSILNGTGQPYPALPGLVKTLPNIDLVEPDQEPAEFLKTQQENAPDLVMVYLNGQHSPPDWLEQLSSKHPQTAVLLCSGKVEPDFLLRSMRLGVREVLPLPLVREDLQAALDRVRVVKKRLADPLVTEGKVIAVTSHNGGVGVTTITVNMGLALAGFLAEKVALVDLGRPFPDVATFLDFQAPYNILDLMHNADKLDKDFIQKIVHHWKDNLDVLPGISEVKAPLNQEAVLRVLGILRGLYKLIIVDLGHWVDEIQFGVLNEADLVLVLTELTVPNIRNVNRLWSLWKELQLPLQKVKLLVNRHQKTNGLGIRNLEHVLKETVLGSLPLDSTPLQEAVNRGVPVTSVAPGSKFSSTLQDLAKQVYHQTFQGEIAACGRPRKRFWVF
jgi:pilus assembly protein CpaE